MCLWLVIPVSSHFEQTSGSRQNRPIFSTKVVNQNTGFTLSCPFAEQALYKNSPLRGNSTGHVLAKQNDSSRQWLCVATSNWHVHFLSLFVTCYKCFIMPRKVGLAATSKVKTFTDVVLGLLQFPAKIKQARLGVVPHFSSGIVERAKRGRAWTSPHARKMTFLAWVDFHARSRFGRSTIPDEKWGTTRSLKQANVVMKLPSDEIKKNASCFGIMQICDISIECLLEGIDYLHFPSTLWFSMFNTTNN